MALHSFKNQHFSSNGNAKDFNKALVAVGSFTYSWWTRFSDFTKSILKSLKLETLSTQISSSTSALTMIFINVWKISTRDASKKGTIDLSAWKASKKPLSWLAILHKFTLNFSFIFYLHTKIYFIFTIINKQQTTNRCFLNKMNMRLIRKFWILLNILSFKIFKL